MSYPPNTVSRDLPYVPRPSEWRAAKGGGLKDWLFGARYSGPHDYFVLRTRYSSTYRSSYRQWRWRYRRWVFSIAYWPIAIGLQHECKIHDPYWREAGAYRINLGDERWG